MTVISVRGCGCLSSVVIVCDRFVRIANPDMSWHVGVVLLLLRRSRLGRYQSIRVARAVASWQVELGVSEALVAETPPQDAFLWHPGNGGNAETASETSP